ncbi:hypothetical protein D3C73_539130 [compost metagenome]
MKLSQLQQLKKEGYEILYRKNDKQYFIPLKVTYENVLSSINQTPLNEDDLLDISSAIENYHNYEEYLTTIKVIYFSEQ